MYIKLNRMELPDTFPYSIGLALADVVVPVLSRKDARVKGAIWPEGSGDAAGHVVLIADVAEALRERRFERSATQLLECVGQSRLMWLPAQVCEPALLH